jgi:hypothetical protein
MVTTLCFRSIVQNTLGVVDCLLTFGKVSRSIAGLTHISDTFVNYGTQPWKNTTATPQAETRFPRSESGDLLVPQLTVRAVFHYYMFLN